MNISQWKIGDRSFFSLEVNDRLLLTFSVPRRERGSKSAPAAQAPSCLHPGRFRGAPDRLGHWIFYFIDKSAICDSHVTDLPYHLKVTTMLLHKETN